MAEVLSRNRLVLRVAGPALAQARAFILAERSRAAISHPRVYAYYGGYVLVADRFEHISAAALTAEGCQRPRVVLLAADRARPQTTTAAARLCRAARPFGPGDTHPLEIEVVLTSAGWSAFGWGRDRRLITDLTVRVVDELAAPVQTAGLPIERAEAPDPYPWTRSRILVGPERWESWRDFVIAVVGCGRTGSAVTESLVAQGARSVVLIDEDRLEASNLDGMPSARHTDIGCPKVEAMGITLARLRRPGLRVQPIAAPLETSRALEAVIAADIVVTSVDRDAPRLMAAAVTRRLLQYQLDIGTATDPISGLSGADVRLICPWGPCLLCTGGVADVASAAAVITERPGRRDVRPGTSARSINVIAAEIGVQMLLDTFHRGGSSRWLRLSVGRDGLIASSRPESRTPDILPA